MSKTIWKYRLTEISNSISVPRGAEILSVGIQYGTGCIWMLVNPSDLVRNLRTFIIHGTGQPIEGEVGKHIGTFQNEAQGTVWHIFETMA